jgi:C-terminal processing protease CtpA/Prc
MSDTTYVDADAQRVSEREIAQATPSRSLSPVVVSVTAGSPAAKAGVAAGDEIVRINGDVPRDIIEWQMAADEADVELDVSRGGLDLAFSIEKRDGESLGVDV